MLGWLLAVAPALAEESSVPLYSREEALALALEPRSRMLDDTTCEHIEGHSAGGRELRPGARAVLFRRETPNAPFMRVVARRDGVSIARFQATAGEVIVSRGIYHVPGSRKPHYTAPTFSTCVAGNVQVGEALPVADE